MTGPFVPVGILNPIRAVVGIHNHRFNLFVKRSSTIRSANAALCLAQKRQRYCASAAAPFLGGEQDCVIFDGPAIQIAEKIAWQIQPFSEPVCTAGVRC